MIQSVTLIKREIYSTPPRAGTDEHVADSVLVKARSPRSGTTTSTRRGGRRGWTASPASNPTGISGGWRIAALELDPGGTREVTEHVLEHEPRRLHRVAFEDPETPVELSATFAIEGEGTVVTQELDYRLRDRGAFA